jgi:hypothetical protein
MPRLDKNNLNRTHLKMWISVQGKARGGSKAEHTRQCVHFEPHRKAARGCLDAFLRWVLVDATYSVNSQLFNLDFLGRKNIFLQIIFLVIILTFPMVVLPIFIIVFHYRQNLPFI